MCDVICILYPQSTRMSKPKMNLVSKIQPWIIHYLHSLGNNPWLALRLAICSIMCLSLDYKWNDKKINWRNLYFLCLFIHLLSQTSPYGTFVTFGSLVKNCNHKGLGIYYLLSAFIFGISGTLISVLIRIELYSSGNRIISPENQNFYNISITLHGFLMIFFLVMPGLFGGFGNYFVPIFQGSGEVVYPRVNNFSILILSLSYLFLILSLISEFGGGTGWTLYPPLSTSFMSLSPSSTAFMVFGLLMSGISSSLTSVNFWTTILNLRSYYLTLKTMPLFPWALLITSGMLLLTLPILSGALLMVLAVKN